MAFSNVRDTIDGTSPSTPSPLIKFKIKKHAFLGGKPKNLHCQLCCEREGVGVVRHIGVAIFLSGVAGGPQSRIELNPVSVARSI